MLVYRYENDFEKDYSDPITPYLAKRKDFSEGVKVMLLDSADEYILTSTLKIEERFSRYTRIKIK